MASTTQPTSAKRARPEVKEESVGEGHSGGSAIVELKKLVEGNAASLKQMGDVLKAVSDKAEASTREQLKQIGEMLKATSDKAEASNREQLNRMEETLKAANDKSVASTREQLKQMGELFKANEDRVNKVEASLMETARNSKQAPANPKSVTHEGTILFPFKVEALQKTQNKWLESEKVNLMGALWYVAVEEKHVKSVGYLVIYLNCNPLEEGALYDTNFALQLLGSEENWTKTAKGCFTKKTKAKDIQGWGWADFVKWSTFLDKADNGFIDAEGCARVQANFTFKIQRERQSNPFFKHTSFNSDCVLLVKKQRVHVNKGLLSVHSAYFDMLFNKDFNDKDQEEITVEDDVEAFEFTQLLEALYPSAKHEITASNVECLLRMADRFQVEVITQRCEVFLRGCSTTTIPVEKKLVLAQDYRLNELKVSCIAEYRTWEDVKKLKVTPEYALLTSETKELVLDSI